MTLLLQRLVAIARRAGRVLLWAGVTVMALAVATWGLLLAPAPRVVAVEGTGATMSPAHARQAAQWLRATAAQAGLGAPAPGASPLQPLPGDAVQALAQDLLSRGFGAAAGVRVQLMEGEATLALSVPLRRARGMGAWRTMPNWLPQWLNIEARLGQSADERLPRLRALRVGHVGVPVGPRAQAAMQWVAHQAARRLGWQARANQMALALAAVQQVRLQLQGIQVQLLPAQLLGQRLGAMLLPGVPLEGLQPFCQALVQAMKTPPVDAAETAALARGPVPFHRLLQPLVALSAQRAGPDPAAAALAQELHLANWALALYATRLAPEFLSTGLHCAMPAHRTVQLAGREDHALHFLLSALLAQGAHPLLADAVGLYKELADVGDPNGSGFSFDDLVADKAGAAFGLLSRNAPHVLVQRLTQMHGDAFLMPTVQGLPSPLTGQQLQAELGGYGSPKFLAWMAEVERRVQNVPALAPAMGWVRAPGAGLKRWRG